MQITNKTPWNTDSLIAFVGPWLTPTGIKTVEFYNQTPRPGVRRENQILCEVDENSVFDYQSGKVTSGPTELKIGLLSPKRAKARLDPLERLARAATLEAYEIDLPLVVIKHLVHTFTWLKKRPKETPTRDYYQWRSHVKGYCKDDCKKEKVIAPPTIPGDTRVKTGNPVTLERLQQKLRWAERSVDSLTEKLEKETKARDRLLVRVDKKLAQHG
jgi:hypothetical protein